MSGEEKVIGLYEFAASAAVLKARQAKYVERFREHGARRVLDLGCGRGLFLEALREVGIEGHGVDASEEAVEECRGKGFKEVTHGDVLVVTGNWAAEGRRYDGVFCSHLIEHLPVAATVTLLRNVRQLLYDGSLLILVTPNPASYPVISEGFWLDPAHIRPYPRALVEQLLKNLGFALQQCGDDPDTRPESPSLRLPYRGGRLRCFLERWLLGDLPRHLWHAFTCGQDQYFIAESPPLHQTPPL